MASSDGSYSSSAEHTAIFRKLWRWNGDGDGDGDGDGHGNGHGHGHGHDGGQACGRLTMLDPV